MGSKIEDLLKITKEERDKLIDGWFQMFIGRSLYQVMNTSSNEHTNEQQMKFIFLAKTNSGRIKSLLEEMKKSSFY